MRSELLLNDQLRMFASLTVLFPLQSPRVFRFLDARDKLPKSLVQILVWVGSRGSLSARRSFLRGSSRVASRISMPVWSRPKLHSFAPRQCNSAVVYEWPRFVYSIYRPPDLLEMENHPGASKWLAFALTSTEARLRQPGCVACSHSPRPARSYF